ncbi:MAG: ATP-binding cassette domain-containing protein [Halobacteriota archaeon]
MTQRPTPASSQSATEPDRSASLTDRSATEPDRSASLTDRSATEPDRSASARERSVLVSADSIGVRLDGERVWSDVDIDVRAGETVAVVGSNGAGKSVLLSCLAGASEPTCGAVTAHRGGVAYLPQSDLLPRALTGREAISFVDRIDDRMSDRWRSLVGRFDVADALDSLIDTYSIGMRRKLELAVVLAIDAPAYVLDEPTAGVDPSIRPAVRDAIGERATAGSGVVLSTHHDDDTEICDRVARIDSNTLVAGGRDKWATL